MGFGDYAAIMGYQAGFKIGTSQEKPSSTGKDNQTSDYRSRPVSLVASPLIQSLVNFTESRDGT